MIELSVPGGSYSISKKAFELGADSVHICLKGFSLGIDSKTLDSLSFDELFTLKSKGKIYCTVDRFLHNNGVRDLDETLSKLPSDLFDRFIISDIGVLSTVRKHFPKLKLTISSFANCLNSKSAGVFEKLGFDRVILGHETPLKDIEIIKKDNPYLELEVQVHGTMCMSYSGRKLLSSYKSGADSLQGLALEEEQRKGSYFPIKEKDGFITILSSKQISLLGHLLDLSEFGVSVFRIENPEVSEDYLKSFVPLYRNAIDTSSQGEFLKGFSTGFFFSNGAIEEENC